MKIDNIDDIKLLLSQTDRKIFWIRITAYMRVLPALFLWKNFEILCYKNSLDNEILRKITKIHSLQENWEKIQKLSTFDILKSNYVKNLFALEKEVNLQVYKNTTEIEEFAIKNWYNFIWNSVYSRSRYENKKEFRDILSSIWVKTITWENMTYNDFIAKNYDFFSQKYWNKIVVQLPDINMWWGIWTIFINSNEDFINFQEKIANQTYKNTKIFSLNITKFITWISSSITWCATKFWTLSTKIQTQIIDIPEVISLKKWNWIFCWHDWSFKKYNDKVNKKASEMVEKIWNFMYKNWYKWIFGLDLIVNEEEDQVYIVECNSRYTWAFPMISFIDLKNSVIPMDAFHIMEFLDINYEIDFDKINSNYKYDKTWSHIILSNKNDDAITIKKDLLPWVYSFTWLEISYLREWIWYNDIKAENEFIIIDWNPSTGEKIRWTWELSSFCHLLFPFSIIENENTLNEKAKNIINIIYKQYT